MYNVRGVECFGCTCKRDCQLQIEIHIVYCVCGARRCSRKLDETAKYTNGTESSSVQHVLKIVQCIRGKENNIKNTKSFLEMWSNFSKGIKVQPFAMTMGGYTTTMDCDFREAYILN